MRIVRLDVFGPPNHLFEIAGDIRQIVDRVTDQAFLVEWLDRVRNRVDTTDGSGTYLTSSDFIL